MSSSRRASVEVNILAMLDGLATRPQARRKLLWYGAGGLLSCALAGTLAWMAHDPAPPTQQPVVAVALPAPASVQVAAPAVAQLTLAAQSRPDPAPAALPAPSGGATIVNLPALSGADAAPALAARAPLEPSQAAPHAALHPAPTPRHAPGSTPRTAPPRPAGRTSVAAVHGAAHPAAKRHAGASRAATAPAAVDTDVALISAIMQHAANGHEGGADGGCGDKPCAARTPMQP